MAVENGIIVAPVSLSNINDVLGTQHADLGYACEDVHINMWAKYKPVRSGMISTANEYDKNLDKWKDNATWWRAGGMCSLETAIYTELGSITNTNSFLYKLTHQQLGWSYLKPVGGVNSVYRMIDFVQYNHSAVEPVGAMSGDGGTIWAPSSGSGTRVVSFNFEAPAELYNLTLADFTYNGVSFANYYLGAVLVKRGTNTYIVATSTSKIGVNGSTIADMELGYSDVGTYDIYPFVSSVYIAQGGQASVGVYLSACNKKYSVTIASTSEQYIIYADAVWTNRDYTQLGWTAEIHNKTSQPKTFTNGITVSIYETDEDATSGEDGTLVASYNYNTTFTVPANDIYTIPASVYIQLIDEYVVATMSVTKRSRKMYWVSASFNDGTHTQTTYSEVQDVIIPDL